MIGQGYGRIVNLRSQAEAAIAHLTRCLAVEWGATGSLLTPCPDLHPHPGTEPALADPAFRADVEERIAALYRISEPMDVAGAVVFLASPAADLITGITLLVDGGWTAR
jgi:NAD(P)-dependent dehydrogenase (short-subunit alcohol dehydrogenase family)